MGRFIYSEDGLTQRVYVPVNQPRSHYGFFKFLFDCFATVPTCGLWLIWVIIREVRAR